MPACGGGCCTGASCRRSSCRTWTRRRSGTTAFLDASEYDLELWAYPLQLGGDCPSNAAYLDGYYADQDGNPVKGRNLMCVFERHAGDIAWRHTEPGLRGQLITEVRPDVSLVVRMVVSAGNYDYILDWGVQERLHQACGVSHRNPRGEGDFIHARRRDQGGRARHAGRREHARHLPRPLYHVPPGPRHRRDQQFLRQEHHHHEAQHRGSRHRRRRHAEAELLDGAARGGRDRGGRASGLRRRARRSAVREPGQGGWATRSATGSSRQARRRRPCWPTTTTRSGGRATPSSRRG